MSKKSKRKVTVKDYMNYFFCSKSTAKRYRMLDYESLENRGIKTKFITVALFHVLYNDSPFNF